VATVSRNVVQLGRKVGSCLLLRAQLALKKCLLSTARGARLQARLSAANDASTGCSARGRAESTRICANLGRGLLWPGGCLLSAVAAASALLKSCQPRPAAPSGLLVGS